MRPSFKRSLTGLLIAGALVFSATAASAMGCNSNGPDAFIGIVGGNPGSSVGGIPYNLGGYQGGSYRVNSGYGYQYGYGGYGEYGHGY